MFNWIEPCPLLWLIIMRLQLPFTVPGCGSGSDIRPESLSEQVGRRYFALWLGDDVTRALSNVHGGSFQYFGAFPWNTIKSYEVRMPLIKAKDTCQSGTSGCVPFITHIYLGCRTSVCCAGLNTPLTKKCYVTIWKAQLKLFDPLKPLVSAKSQWLFFSSSLWFPL